METKPDSQIQPELHQSGSDSEKTLDTKTPKLGVVSTVRSQGLEKQEDGVLPPKRRFAFLRYTLLNTYRRLFGLVFLGNVAALAFVMATDQKMANILNVSAANLLVAGLVRQPLVINLLYIVVASFPKSAPLRLRILAARVFHMGGVHSACGIACCIWYISFAALYTRYNTRSPVSTAALVLTYLILILLVLIIVAAHPTLRMRKHDYFELTHRFSGWACVVLFWALLLTLASQEQLPMGSFLVSSPAFWFLIVITLAIVHPWALLRKVKVRPESLSSHAIRLHFDHTAVQYGKGISVAKHPLRDWHAFATITDRFDSPDTKFSCVISKAGDWTSDIIAHPPTHLWKRAVPVYGFGYCMGMFNRLIIVATGSGIGPLLTFIGDKDRAAMRVLWQTRDPLKTYGQRTIDLVRKLDPDPVVLDTTKMGKRTDMFPRIMQLFHEFEAEAICIISNPTVTKKIVFECDARGFPAYGPNWDS